MTIAASFFGLLGIAGIYARQVEEAGWLGLAGFVLLSLWLVVVTGFTFFEAFVLPLLAIDSPRFTEGFLGIFTGAVGETKRRSPGNALDACRDRCTSSGRCCSASPRSALGILSRWAAALLGLGAGWVINLAVAEYVIRRRPGHGSNRTSAGVGRSATADALAA